MSESLLPQATTLGRVYDLLREIARREDPGQTSDDSRNDEHEEAADEAA